MMLEVSEAADDEGTFIDIKVQNPSKEYGKYISYEIVIKTNDPSFSYRQSSTRRRYSDFVTLTRLLSKQLPHSKLPVLPQKHPFKNSFDVKLIQERQQALQDFLNELVTDRMFLSSKALHLFLQSSFSMSEIQDINEGKTSSDQIQRSPNSNFYDSISYVGDETENIISSHSNSDQSSSINSSCAVLKPSSQSNTNSPLDKKVKFCDEVTVAEVHIA